ncbi:phage tail protein [Synechococcus sp. PCC 7336]|uniref:phage tail protein n=1 Tax=Synechococcus sp. PCC 7336 TaxID=195250 RepID=UPI00034CCD1B|nr:phage tail protein [Synechococcus sp. PCC 7336]
MATFPEILTNSRFYLELKLDGSKEPVDGYFMECSGFQYSQEVTEIVEVTPQKWGKNGNSRGRLARTKIPGHVTFSNLTLKRGLTTSSSLWDWVEKVEEGNWSEQRQKGSLTIYNQAAKQQVRWEFQRAWPVSYQISDLDVKSGDFNIEEIELAVEDLRRVRVPAS